MYTYLQPTYKKLVQFFNMYFLQVTIQLLSYVDINYRKYFNIKIIYIFTNIV